jgi:D-arginine dehydrogenase
MPSTTADILIIGGGVAGLSAAAALASHGKVVVLEAEDQTGFHSSGRSAALLHYALGNPPVRRLTMASRALFENPQDGFDAPLSSVLPILTPARADELAALQALADELVPFTAIDWLDAAGLRRECPVLRIGPGDAEHGFIDRTALKLDGHGLLQVYSHQLRAAGGEIHGNSRIASIGRTGQAWQVRTERGDTYDAPVLINAAGAWGDSIATLAKVRPIGLQPKRRTIIVFDAPEGVDVARLPFTKTVADEIYFGPEAGRIFASPMDEIDSGPCDAQPEEYEMALAAHRIEERTVMTVSRIAHRWAGLRTFAPDRLPVVGFAPDAPGFFWLAGQGGAGLQTSPALAAIAAAMIAGTSWPVPEVHAEELSPARFFG